MPSNPIVISDNDPLAQTDEYARLPWTYADGDAESLISSKGFDIPDLVAIRKDWMEEHTYTRPNGLVRLDIREDTSPAYYKLDVYGEAAVLIPNASSYDSGPFDKDCRHQTNYIVLESDPALKWYMTRQVRKSKVKEACRRVAALLYASLGKHIDDGLWEESAEVMNADTPNPLGLFFETVPMANEEQVMDIASNADAIMQRRNRTHEKDDDSIEEHGEILGEEWVKQMKLQRTDEFRLLPAAMKAKQVAESRVRQYMDKPPEGIESKDFDKLRSIAVDFAGYAAEQAVIEWGE